MNIGLFFGSFNPIHHGHLIIANHVLNTTALSHIWFVISPQNPFKDTHSLLNEHHRKHLVDLAIEADDRLKSSNIEFHLPRPSYTIDTLVHLGEQYPRHQFHLIVGSDSYQNMHKWKNAELLVKNYPILVYARPGFDIESDKLKNVSVLSAPLLQISSSYIRDLIQRRKSIRYLVPEIVREEILAQQYYF